MPSHLPTLCLSYHRIRQIPSWYSGALAPTAQKNGNSSDIYLKTQLRSYWPPLQLSIPISYTIYQAAWEAHRKGLLLLISLPMDDDSGLGLGITGLLLFRGYLSESLDNFNGSLKSHEYYLTFVEYTLYVRLCD